LQGTWKEPQIRALENENTTNLDAVYMN
jgi:hypothetical protein